MAAHKGKFGRRKLLAGAVALAGGTVATVAKARHSARKHLVPDPPPEVAAFFGDVRAGAELGEYRVAAVYPVHMGAIPVLLEHDGEQFQIDVLRRDDRGPAPVGQTPSLSLFLANQGNGRRPTNERHGLGALALASALAEREARVKSLPELLTLRERSKKFPDGFYSVA
jgi:hypothetical protein